MSLEKMSLISSPITKFIDSLRKRLIDQSGRNSLINFRFRPGSRTSLEIATKNLDQIWKRLYKDEASLGLLPISQEVALKDNKKESESGKREKYIEVVRLTDEEIESKADDDEIVVNLEKQKFNSNCNNVRRKADSLIKETGINHLYLALGYLKWFESQDSEKARKSPLVLLPISITCSTKAGNSEKKYEIKYFDEELEPNTSLKVTLESQFGFLLPFIEQEETICDYLQRLATLIKQYNGWEIEYQAHIGFFSFTKLRMYEDLNSDNWPKDKALEDNVLIQKILEGSQKSENDAIYGENEVHDEHQTAHKIPLVMEADSSQHTAILKVSEGLNTVIEGPPGTGKSQTITNIIGNAIFAGKSVLFVSEKQAALNVVKENLEQAGLSDFCLELHSSKANRQEVFHSLEKRIRNKKYEPQGLQETRDNWELCVNRLLSYIRKCSEKEGFLELELYRYFLKAFALRENNIPSLRHKLQSPSSSKKEYESCLQILNKIVERFKDADKIVNNQWKYFKVKNFNPGDEVFILPIIKQIDSTLNEIIEKDEYLKNEVSKEINLKIYKNCSYEITETTFDEVKKYNSELLKFLSNEDNVKELTEACSQIQRIDAIRKSAAEIFKDEAFAQDEAIANIQAIAIQLCEMGLSAASHQEIFKQIPYLLEVEKEVLAIASELSDYENNNIFSIKTLNELKEKLPLISKISEKPQKHQNEITGDLFFPATIDKIKQAITRQDYAKSKINEAEKDVYLDNITHEDIKILHHTFKKFLGNPFSILFGEYRKAKKEYFKISKSEKKSKKDILRNLEKARDAHEAQEKYCGDVFLSSLCGRNLTLQDDLNIILVTAEWALDLASEGLSLETINKIYIDADPFKYRNKENRITQAFVSVQKTLKDCDQLLNAFLKGNSPYDYEIKTLPRYFKELAEWLRASLSMLEQYTKRRLTAHEISNVASQLLEAKIEERKITDNKKLIPLFEKNQRARNEIQEIENALKWLRQLEAVVPTETLSQLLAKDSVIRIQKYKKIYSSLSKITANLQQLFHELSRFGEVLITNSQSKYNEYREIKEKTQLFLISPNSLNDWAFFSKVLTDAAQKDAHMFINEALSGRINLKDLSKSFELSQIEYYAYKKLSECKDLEAFISDSHDSLRKKFQTIDKKLLRLNRDFLAFKASQRNIPIGITKGTAKDRTERGLIEHEISKTRKHIPIRELMKRAGRAVRALKPCVMMSPLSVAQYLDTSLEQFDLVVMDEASQIRPEDALGAIARGKQLVVVGDTKQMPPSTFYQSIFEEEQESEDVSTAEDSESVLECGLHSFAPVYRLKWHYRSRHEKLIRFSNYYYYDNELVVFPSTGTGGNKLGIFFNFIDDATFQGRQNIKEAEVVAKAAIKHCINNPNESLMIVTMNIPQQDLIESIIDKMIENDPVARKAVEEACLKNEEFTVKNLENIQGHQRDVVFISMTYGKDPDSKKVMQRFGPINGKSGRRRLNVLFTRAKNRNEIFTSMRYQDILGSTGQESGVNDLRNYLKFSETGVLADEGIVTGHAPDSEFEESVIRVIQSTGLIATPQVGVGGYRIDIGISKPENRDQFILGIECDGASYHSSRSARDRDRLREEALVSRGWKIFRIWSTDWFYRHNEAKQRLLNALSESSK